MQVSLESGEAIVTYDPRQTAVEALVAAVNAADGPMSPRQYLAEVKDGPHPTSGP